MHYRFTLIRCLCLAVLLTVCQAGCHLHRKPARRADFVSRIIPPPGCGTADNMMIGPGRKEPALKAAPPNIPSPRIHVPEAGQPDVPPLVPPTPSDPAPNNPSLTEFFPMLGDNRSLEIVPPGQLAKEIIGKGPHEAAGPVEQFPASNNLPDECLLGLEQAVATALRQNPQLAVARAEIGKAAAGKKAAFSAFLPRVGAVDTLNIMNIGVGSAPGSTLAPFLPLQWNSQYNQIELETQWIIWDFGRRTGTYRQADILEQIAQLKYQRACQTVAYDAAEAYYRVLLAYSTVVTARNTLRRAEEFLRVSNNLFEQGEVDRESVYSAELQVAKARQLCVSARTRVNTTTARLNLTMGQNTVCPTRVRLIEGEPAVDADLFNCLHTAVACRLEVQVVSDWVAKAQEATGVAKADFMPKVISNASYTSTGGNFETDIKYAYIAFAWDIYAGGKRAGKLMEERADTARAVASGRQVCDRIAFEVNYAYQKVEDAAKRIDLARSAVRLARERLRIVMNKFEQGEDSPTDVVDAQTAMTVAEQQYFDTIFQLRSAVARLEYAMGVN